ncbi:hypothetical protein Hanom_Chr09g00790411 [Helianthus anomalus]
MPSESEIDLGVFSAKAGNLLEKMYKSAGSRGVRKINISKITLPESPPSQTFDLSTPRPDPNEKGKGVMWRLSKLEKMLLLVLVVLRVMLTVLKLTRSRVRLPLILLFIQVHQVQEEVVRPGFARVRNFELFKAWDTYNPARDDLPHAPRWNLTQGSRMSDIDNCREFFSLSLPPAERMFQKRRHRMDLLDDHIHAGVNFYATSQEIVREWQLMGEDTLKFEATNKELAEEKEKFNAEKKGLAWRVADAEDKLAKEKQFNATKQKEWEAACERTNREMKTARDAIVKLRGEKTKISEEAEQERTSHQKRESEYIQRIAKLQQLVTERSSEIRASEIIAEEANADCKWLLARGVPLVADRIVKSDELAKYMFELGEAAYNNGRKDGYGEWRAAAEAKEAVSHFDLYKTDCAARYAEKRQEYEFLEFAIVKAVGKLSRKVDGVELLKKALGDQDLEVEGDGPSQQG